MRVIRKTQTKNQTMASKKPLSTTPEKGSGISARKVDGYLRFLLFLTAIGMGYIWNTHYAVRQVRKLESLKAEVKDLKSKYLMRESSLRAGMRMAEVAQYVDTMGLRPLSQPPYKIIKPAQQKEDKQLLP